MSYEIKNLIEINESSSAKLKYGITIALRRKSEMFG